MNTCVKDQYLPAAHNTARQLKRTLLVWLFMVCCPGFAQDFAVLHHFGGTTNADGANPLGGLVLSGDTLYGTTQSGGWSNRGTVFSVKTDGSGYQVLKHFAGSDGAYPEASLVVSGSILYGTTRAGGGGTVFRISADGSDHSIIRMLDGATEGSLLSGPVLLSGATLYGTASWGGSYREGTLFKLNTDGSGFTVLKHFMGGSDGSGPRGHLVLSGSTLYGITHGSGGQMGTLYAIGTDGSNFQVLRQFGGLSEEGACPKDGLLVAGTTLYGTTTGLYVDENPPIDYRGTIYRINTDGTGFGVLALCDGAASLVLSGNALYGASEGCGQPYCKFGTLFKYGLIGSGFRTLKDFTLANGADGSNPRGDIVVSGDTLYGVTASGGPYSNGVVYALSLAPRLVNAACDGTNFSFSLQTEVGEDYTVEHNDDMARTNWLLYQTLTGDGLLMKCCVPLTNAGPRFFRVRQP